MAALPTFPVNQEPRELQLNATVGASREGTGWVAWNDVGFDNNSLRARRFSGLGALAGELVVYPSSDCSGGPDLASNRTGDIALVWDACTAFPGALLQIFDSAGEASMLPVLLVDPPAWAASLRVAWLDESSLVVTWWGPNPDDPAAGNGPLARLFDATGHPTSGYVPLAPGAPEGVEQLRSTVADLGDLGFVAVWQSGREFTAAGSEIVARRFAADGTPLGDPFPVNQTLAGEQYTPDVDSDAGGNFVVVWESFGQDGSGSGVFARRFAPDGTPLGDELQANVDPFFDQIGPRVTVDPGGAFLVVWNPLGHSPFAPGTPYFGQSIWGRWFGANGAPRSGDLQLLDEPSPISEAEPRAAISRAGLALLVAEGHPYDGDDEGLVGRWLVFPCEEDGTTACLDDGRFLVRAEWETADGARGFAAARSLTSESAAFSFFGEDNLELLVKVLDGCGVNDRHWVYAAGLTDVEVVVTVTDRYTGEVWSHRNDMGTRFPPVHRVEALSGCCASPPAPVPEYVGPDGAVASAAGERGGPADGGVQNDGTDRGVAPATPRSEAACVPSETQVCLRGRFSVSARFDAGPTHVGEARALPYSNESGLLWFFAPENVELLVKVLDGCAINGAYWVYAAGLTDAFVEIEVLDTWTGELWTRSNPRGTPFPPIHDVDAFGGCSAGPPS
ncbi:MAG: hypothetical protein KDB94_07700 [Acidobacteria bacterium]|nr:hypothetical protein [Acidobacteriota bacterium]